MGEKENKLPSWFLVNVSSWHCSDQTLHEVALTATTLKLGSQTQALTFKKKKIFVHNWKALVFETLNYSWVSLLWHLYPEPPHILQLISNLTLHWNNGTHMANFLSFLFVCSALEVYWNIPSFMCKKHRMNFSSLVPTYGIRQNKDDKFQWVYFRWGERKLFPIFCCHFQLI